MTTIDIIRNKIDLKAFKSRSALETDYAKLINDDCLVTEKGEPKILYIKCPVDTLAVREACKNINYINNTRTRGLKTSSAIFGYNPRNPIRKNFCSATAMAYNQPKEHELICNFGKSLAHLYAQYFPKVFTMHNKLVEEKIKAEWKIKDCPFTSGIVNRNNPLKYHFDAGNIKDVLSNMVVFKDGVKGGFLSCPEFNLGFEVADNTLILFDGQSILHGVTPIRRITADSYRYSIVYYTLEQLWQCLPIDEEIIRARKMHLNRENKRANNEVKPGDLTFDKIR